MKKLKFFVNRTYKSSKRYKIREKTTMEKLNEFMKKLSESRFLSKKKKKKRKGINLTLIFVLVFVLAIGGLIGYLIWVLQNLPQPVIQQPFVKSDPLIYYYGSYGTIFERNKGILISADVEVKNSFVNSLTLYPSSSPLISRNVYILKTGKFDVSDESYYSFIDYMKKEAVFKNYNSELISIEELSTIPPGSYVVIPSGRFPLELREKFKESISRGINFIYIGANPSSNAVSYEGELFTLKEDYDPLRIIGSSIDYKELSSDVLKVRNPVYVLTNSKLIYGVVSYKAYKKGSFFVFPVVLDQGWKDMREAALDVMKVVTSPSYLLLGENLRAEKRDISNGENNLLFRVPSLSKEEVWRSYVAAVKAESGELFDYSLFPVYYGYGQKGYFYPTSGPAILPMSISKKALTFNYKIEGSGKETFNLVVYAENNSIIDRKTVDIFLGDEGNFKYYNEDLDVGKYVFSLEDSLGNVYATTLIEIAPLEVKITPDFETAEFKFEFLVGNKKAVVDKVKIYFDGRVFEDEKVSEVDVDLFDYFQGRVPAGTYYFTVESGKTKKELSVYNPPKTAISRILFNNPINMGLLITSIILFTVSSFIKPRIDRRLFIDIPDFPPTEKIKVSLKEKDVIDVIEFVNKYYKWKHTPLKVHEIKMGFRKVIVKGSPLLISDFNLEYILEKLVEKGRLKKILDYYGIVDWEKQSGFSLEELALFRKLRDICVEYTVPFSPLTKGKYNTKIKLMFKDMYVLFFTPKKPFMSIVRKSINLVKDAPVLILTLSDDEKELVLDYAFQSGKEVSLFRHYVERGLVSIMTIKEFEKMLKEFSS